MSKMPKQNRAESKQDYQTPSDILHAVKNLLWIKDFTHDFAASPTNAVCSSYWTEQDDSLSKDADAWRSMVGTKGWGIKGWGWLNPPYANITPWVEKCAEAGFVDGAHIALLVPASVGANWFRDFVHAKARVLFLNGRITFVGCTTCYPKDCILALYGSDVKIGYDVFDWRKGCLS